MHDIRQNKNHIVIIDGTLSRLDRGFETHCGKLYKLAMNIDGARRKVYYDHGVQGKGLYKWVNVASGNGLNKSVMRSYRKLSENYRQGDQIFIFGYSRGAYAARLLAGLIDKMGLLKPAFATRPIAEQTFLLNSKDLPSAVLSGFKRKYCTQKIDVNFLGVWDTVKALGLPIPFLHRYSPFGIKFKDYSLPANIKLGCQALAFHEDRSVYRPELWRSCAPTSKMKQVLFAGTHSVVGGQNYRVPNVHYLSAYALHWMLDEAQSMGLELPTDWKMKYPSDVNADYNPKEIRNRGIWRKMNRRFQPDELFKTHPSLIEFEKRVNSIY